MKNKLATIVIFLASLGVGIGLGIKNYSPKPPAPAAAAQFYSLNLSNAQGEVQALSKLRGKVVVLNFWAPWCPPCVEELPEFDAVARANKNVAFIGIGIDNAENIKQFAVKNPLSFPLLVAGLEGTTLGKAFGNEKGGLPFTVILQPDGSVAWQKMGRVKGDELTAALSKIKLP